MSARLEVVGGVVLGLLLGGVAVWSLGRGIYVAARATGLIRRRRRH